jgi:hypothetical protein
MDGKTVYSYIQVSSLELLKYCFLNFYLSYVGLFKNKIYFLFF